MFGIIVVSALLATLGRAQDCVLQVPANPLTAQGLATPWVQSGCSQRADTASFVECAIYDRKGGLSYYHPLIIDQGDKVGVNFVAPVTPVVPAGSVVGCWLGTNGATTTLAGPGANFCVNGIQGSIFGQFAACGAAQFFQVALPDADKGIIKVPALGTASIGGPCPSVRDFRIVDQDQSDNVITQYALLNNNTVVAQATPQNAAGGKATIISNGSDNRLVDAFMDPALGCTPWMVQSLTAVSGMTGGIATNEIQAHVFQAAPIALVPPIDPMVLDNNGNQNLMKTNLYRTAVGQPPLNSLAEAPGIAYCNGMTAGGTFMAANQALLANNPSPMPDVATNLFTFLAQRFAAAIGADNLNCLALWNITTNPVTLTTDANGVVTAATINVPVLQQLGMGQTGTTSSTAASSATTMSTATRPSSSTASAASSSFVFRNTTKSAATATAPAASSNVIQSLTSNVNNGATFSSRTTLATMTAAASNTKSNVAVSTSSAVVGGGTPTSVAGGGGGTGATSSAAAGIPTASCTCPVVAAPTTSPTAQTFVLLADGLVKNTQSGQLYIPVPAFLQNLLAGGGQPGGHGRKRRS